MAERKPIPKGVREQVLKEYRHLCAKCRGPGPQLHHIDEDASNSSDPMNLLPLCPNCHLTDIHSPTQRMDARRIQLFRERKDPTILTSQFRPLFRRILFLFEIDNSSRGDLEIAVQDLRAFVSVLKMGHYYSDKLRELIPGSISVSFSGESESEARVRREESTRNYRAMLHEVRGRVLDTVVESLVYQPWLEDERARERCTGPR